MEQRTYPVKLGKYDSLLVLACKGWSPTEWNEDYLNNLPTTIYDDPKYPESEIKSYSKLACACCMITGSNPEHMRIRDYNHWLYKFIEENLDLFSSDIHLRILQPMLDSREKKFPSVVAFEQLQFMISTLTVQLHDNKVLIEFDDSLIKKDKE